MLLKINGTHIQQVKDNKFFYYFLLYWWWIDMEIADKSIHLKNIKDDRDNS